MRKVNNKKILRRLARAQIRSEGGKNAITIFAIMLTALMLSAIFTLLSGANQAMEMGNASAKSEALPMGN